MGPKISGTKSYLKKESISLNLKNNIHREIENISQETVITVMEDVITKASPCEYEQGHHLPDINLLKELLIKTSKIVALVIRFTIHFHISILTFS